MTPLENIDGLIGRVIADRERAIAHAFDAPSLVRVHVDAFDLNEQLDYLLDSRNRITGRSEHARPSPKPASSTP